MSGLCRKAAVLEGEGLSAMMVLFAKQMHLQKDVVDRAVEPGETSVRRRVIRVSARGDRFMMN